MIGMYPIASVPIADMDSGFDGTLISATTGTIVLDAIDAAIKNDYVIQATTGSITLTPIDAVIKNDYNIIATTGSIRLRGIKAIVVLAGVPQITEEGFRSRFGTPILNGWHFFNTRRF